MDRPQPYTMEERSQLMLRTRPDGFVIVDGARFEATIEAARKDAADRALADVQRWIARVRGERM